MLPLSQPEFGGKESVYLKECIETGWVSSVGPFVDRFELEIGAYVGAKYAVATMNGTAALHAALLTIGLLPDEEVIVPDLTFIACVNAVRYCHAHPVFMDAHPATWQIDPDKLARFLAEECSMQAGACYNRKSGRRVRAVLPVHLLGLACEIDRIVALAREWGLAVVEDAAEAMGVRYRGRHAGSFGDIGAFSFNGNKIVTSGGGGMLVTNDPRLAARARYLTTQARDDELEYVHQEIGYNYRMTNIQAALGLAQFEQLGDFIARRRAIAATYHEAFSELDAVTLMPRPPDVEPTNWLYTILLKDGTTVEARTAVIKRLAARGVGARPIWHPIHALAPYRGCQAFEIEHAVNLHARGISLPSSSSMSAEDVRRCIEAVRESIGRA